METEMGTYTISSLTRLLENRELSDAESHKLYNNLGLLHTAAHAHRSALRAHREEKRICKRLASTTPSAPLRLDLAIAYRLCGDAMLKLDRLQDARGHLLTSRVAIIRAASDQHVRGLAIARSVPSSPAAQLELQAAVAAAAQTALSLALETRDLQHYRLATFASVEAALHATRLPVGPGGVRKAERDAILRGISLNMAIALSGAGRRDRAKAILYRVAGAARQQRDDKNLVRAVSNLAEEAGEDGDWALCARFVREWIRLARKADDGPDEGDALRKLAAALVEQRLFDDARVALERALELAGSRHAEREATLFLDVVKGEITKLAATGEQLEELEGQAAALERNGKFVEEARARLAAGERAFELGRFEDAVRLLGRYFVLVDEYGCNTGITGIKEPAHNTAVANIGEAMWSLKRYEEAVKWATRELTVYGDDVPGQAQAWCNLGVYLDDFGKRENAILALKQSIELANKCGEKEVLKRAQNNLEVVQSAMFNDAEPLAEDVEPAETPPDRLPEKPRERQPRLKPVFTSRQPDDVQSMAGQHLERRVSAPEPHPMQGVGSRGECSIIIESSQPMRRPAGALTECSQGHSSGNARRERLSAHTSGTTKATGNRSRDADRSHPSRDAETADRSSIGVRTFVDLASEYKALCAKRQHPRVPPRAMVINALRALSSTLLARGACDQPSNTPAKLDLSALLLSNHDISVVFETLSKLGAEHHILLDMRLNPLLTPAAYDCLDPRSFAAPSALPSLRKVDLSCSGVSASAVGVLVNALSDQGALSHVTHLNIAKNGLGKQSRPTAVAIGRLVTKAMRLEVLDISLNLLQNTFMQEFVEALDGPSLTQCGNASQRSLRSLDLHLNNRKVPSALLDVPDVDGTVHMFAKLFEILPALECVDVRACGASSEMRRRLRDLAAGFESFAQNIVTVSPAVHDDL